MTLVKHCRESHGKGIGFIPRNWNKKVFHRACRLWVAVLSNVVRMTLAHETYYVNGGWGLFTQLLLLLSDEKRMRGECEID